MAVCIGGCCSAPGRAQGEEGQDQGRTRGRLHSNSFNIAAIEVHHRPTSVNGATSEASFSASRSALWRTTHRAHDKNILVGNNIKITNVKHANGKARDAANKLFIIYPGRNQWESFIRRYL